MAESGQVIRGPRLDLAVMSPALMRAVLASDWDQAGRLLGAPIPRQWRGEDWQWLGQQADQAEADPAVLPWLARVMLLRTADQISGRQPVVVGEAGFHGPPGADGRAEIGYTVVSVHRRRGYAREAARALLAWAMAEQHVTRFRATISPDNTPSLNLIYQLGFVQVGTWHHERRGDELVFHRDR